MSPRTSTANSEPVIPQTASTSGEDTVYNTLIILSSVFMLIATIIAFVKYFTEYSA